MFPLNICSYTVVKFKKKNFILSAFTSAEEEGRNCVCKWLEPHPAEICTAKMCTASLLHSNRCAGLAPNNSLMLSPLQLYLFLELAAVAEISLLPCWTEPQSFVILCGWGLQPEQKLSALHRGKGSRKGVHPPWWFDLLAAFHAPKGPSPAHGFTPEWTALKLTLLWLH